MKKFFVLILTLCLFTIFSGIGLADFEVEINKNAEKDMAKFKTFAFLPKDMWLKHLKHEPLGGIYKIISTAVSKDLIAKGYKQVPIEEADFVAVYTSSLDQKESVSNLGFGKNKAYMGARVRINSYGNIKQLPQSLWDDYAYTTYYDQGKLMLDFYDKKTKELVWRGTGIKNVVSTTPVLQIEEDKLVKGINTIMKQFPDAEEKSKSS